MHTTRKSISFSAKTKYFGKDLDFSFRCSKYFTSYKKIKVLPETSSRSIKYLFVLIVVYLAQKRRRFSWKKLLDLDLEREVG
jgi:hypothetical protein